MKQYKNLTRCSWVKLNKKYHVEYHDEEWGEPVYDDYKHFEMLILEGFQSGLSWEIILKKRPYIKEAFCDFDPKKVSSMKDEQLEKILTNPNVIRNKLKIYGARTNAITFLKIQKEFGSFSEFIWSFVGNKPIKNTWQNTKDIPSYTDESIQISKILKKKGMIFVGPTVIYSHMQSTGLINDHLITCWKYNKIN